MLLCIKLSIHRLMILGPHRVIQDTNPRFYKSTSRTSIWNMHNDNGWGSECLLWMTAYVQHRLVISSHWMDLNASKYMIKMWNSFNMRKRLVAFTENWLVMYWGHIRFSIEGFYKGLSFAPRFCIPYSFFLCIIFARAENNPYLGKSVCVLHYPNSQTNKAYTFIPF